MKRCPKCRYTISAQAMTCPYCNASQPETKGGSGTLLLVISGVVAFVAVANSISGNGSKHVDPAVETTQSAKSPLINETTAGGSKYSDVGKQYGWIEAGKEQIKGRLKDPDSAKFKDVHFYSGGGIPVTCGKVNSKNSFGGYTGFERFIAAGSQLAVVESDMTSPSELDEVWQKFCSRAPTDEA